MNRLGIVIPTLNAAHALRGTVAALRAGGMPFDLVAADGGSSDGTQALAEDLGARVVVAPRGRGRQLAAGARAAQGNDWLLFLHADTILGRGWAEAVRAFMDAPENRERAGYFRFGLDDPKGAARRLEALVALRCKAFALPYGDQGLLLSRTLYEAVGGHDDVELMEDVAIARRLGRGRLVALGARAVTSARRYRQGGYVLRPLRNLFCLGLYLARVPPRLIARIYG